MIMWPASRKKSLVLLLFAWAFTFQLHGWSQQHFPAGYDRQFKTYWGAYLPQHDWLWGKAQCYQESLLKPDAVSHAGAMGLCQQMPPTFGDCRQRLRLPAHATPFVAEMSILCNSWQMDLLHRTWKTQRPKLERLKLAQASYNAGVGHIIKSQRLCGMALLWVGISPCLEQVTGRHSLETLGYVKKIGNWFRAMKKQSCTVG